LASRVVLIYPPTSAQVPGVSCVAVVCYYTASPAVLQALRTHPAARVHPHTPALELIRRFWKADQSYCDAHFKMIPHVQEASWAIKMAVGQKPAMTGQKLTQVYSRGDGYFEIDIDISSSSVANGILSMVW
jgi:hypothetical protein